MITSAPETPPWQQVHAVRRHEQGGDTRIDHCSHNALAVIVFTPSLLATHRSRPESQGFA
jgi:hypothetical protein